VGTRFNTDRRDKKKSAPLWMDMRSINSEDFSLLAAEGRENMSQEKKEEFEG